MTMTQEELREHLLATIEAAPELTAENRAELADVFLRELDQHFMLVPRDARGRVPAAQPPYRMAPPMPVFRSRWLAIPILIALSFVLHLPLFLFAIVLFFVGRAAGRPGWRGGRPMVW